MLTLSWGFPGRSAQLESGRARPAVTWGLNPRGVFDKHGHQLKEHDADEDLPLAVLTCDACGKDV